jgi:hypothetical protein
VAEALEIRPLHGPHNAVDGGQGPALLIRQVRGVPNGYGAGVVEVVEQITGDTPRAIDPDLLVSGQRQDRQSFTEERLPGYAVFHGLPPRDLYFASSATGQSRISDSGPPLPLASVRPSGE